MRPPRWPRWLTPLLAGTAFVAFTVTEMRRPLRGARESKLRRAGRNLATAGLTALTTSALQAVILRPLAARIERRRAGIMNRLPLTGPARIAADVLLLDYTLWWWHLLNHRLPLLWRFHLVHHVDRDMDASTALRFHFGEMGLSVLFRAAQLRILGVSQEAASIWQAMLFVSIAFHHSNIALSPEIDRKLARWIVTPRMHGIHHSDYRDETDSNWSSLFSIWDRLHGTLRLDVPDASIEIGVPAYQRAADVTLPCIIALPFREQRNDWLDATGHPRLTRGDV